jgi:Fic family protein
MFEEKLDFNFTSQQLILKKIASIDHFKGQWSAIEHTDNSYLKHMRKIATIESIGSSTRIEGATLSDSEIENLLSEVKSATFETRDEQEVIGYYDALNIILDNFETIPITPNYIKQLHGILLKHSDKDQRHRGAYKIAPNTVAATYPDGTEKIIFRPTEPLLVEQEMTAVIDWVNAQFTHQSIHPLLVVALFVYEFLSIHPFNDGNGRLSRLLTTILLMKAGYHFVQYISFEHIIEQRKNDYYKALRSGQKNRYQSSEKIDLWVIFFLEGIETLTKKLDVKYAGFIKTGGYLNDRQKIVLETIKAHQPVRLNDILAFQPHLNRNTIKKDLEYLKKENLIQQVGDFKSSSYIIKA